MCSPMMRSGEQSCIPDVVNEGADLQRPSSANSAGRGFDSPVGGPLLFLSSFSGRWSQRTRIFFSVSTRCTTWLSALDGRSSSMKKQCRSNPGFDVTRKRMVLGWPIKSSWRLVCWITFWREPPATNTGIGRKTETSQLACTLGDTPNWWPTFAGRAHPWHFLIGLNADIFAIDATKIYFIYFITKWNTSELVRLLMTSLSPV